MPQVTWRASETLVERAKRAAKEQGRSLNDFITVVLAAATDPELSGSEADRVRERLAAAGVLAGPHAPVRRPDPELVARARAEAGRGTSLASFVAEGR